jgi:hypothetical protein
MSGMKILAVMALCLGLVSFGLALPVRVLADEQSWSLAEILEFGGRALTDAVQRGVEEIQDRIEINANILPRSQEGESSTQLRLRLFPKGKNHPEEQIGADTQFQYSLDPERPHFQFDFRLLPRQNADEYI